MFILIRKRWGTAIAFIRNMKEIGKAGETAIVEKVDNGILYLDNGKCLYAKAASDFIEAGEMRKIELCKGDLIQFNVNLRDRKIYNGNIARITDDPGKVMMLYPDGKPRELIDLPREYRTFKYGWVTTSHKSQGRTSETVVVAAQSLDRKAFYVALSRGRKQMALHCPEKEFLKKQLSHSGDRTSVHDLAEKGEISPDVLIPLSEDARKRKRAILPDFSYKSIKTRAEKFMAELKRIAKRVSEFSRRIKARRARDAKYGYGPVSEKVRLEIEDQNALDAIEREKAAAAKRAAFESMFASPRKLSPYEQAQMELKELGFYQSDQGSEQKESEKHESYFDIMKSVSQKRKDPIVKPDIPVMPVAEKKPEPSAPSMPKQVSVTPSFEPSESLFSFDANKRYMEEINRRYEAKMAEKRRLAEEKEKQAEHERQKARQAELEREETARKQAEELSKKKIEQKVIERPEPKIEKKKPSRGMDL